MKVIVTQKYFHDMEFGEVIPDVFLPRDYETPEEALRRIWEESYNDAVSENLLLDGEDPVDVDNCWCKGCMALLTWKDGDSMEFHITKQITM